MSAHSNSSSTMRTPQEGDPGTPVNGQSPEKSDDRLVSLDPAEDPLCFSTFRKWLAVMVICAGAFCVTCASSVVRSTPSTSRSAWPIGSRSVFPLQAAFTELGMADEFHVSREPTILTISLFVLGPPSSSQVYLKDSHFKNRIRIGTASHRPILRSQSDLFSFRISDYH
jgi:hypothetical protein